MTGNENGDHEYMISREKVFPFQGGAKDVVMSDQIYHKT